MQATPLPAPLELDGLLPGALRMESVPTLLLFGDNLHPSLQDGIFGAWATIIFLSTLHTLVRAEHGSRSMT